MFEESLKDVKKPFRGFAGFDLRYDEFENLFRKSWKDNFIYISFDRSNIKCEGINCICNGNEPIMFVERIEKQNPFKYYLI